MKLKTAFFTILFGVITSSTIFAQSAGASFALGFPMGEFKDNVDRLGWGLNLHFLFLPQTTENPFSIGLNVGFLNYGNETRREGFYNVPEVSVDVDRSNNLVNFHVLFQVVMPTGVIRPYAEALFGGEYLFTETTIENQRNYEEIAGSTNFDDFAWSYGGGAGFLILVHQDENPEDGIGDLFIDLKARYLFGTEAEYLKEGSIELNSNKTAYIMHPSKSKTDLFSVSAGVAVSFNSIIGE